MVMTEWRREGLVAGLIYTILTIVTVAPFRRRSYETFFIIHTVLVLCVFLVSRACIYLTNMHCQRDCRPDVLACQRGRKVSSM